MRKKKTKIKKMKTIFSVLVLALCFINVTSSPVEKRDTESQNESREHQFITGDETDEQAKLIETTTYDYFETNNGINYDFFSYYKLIGLKNKF